MLKKPSLLSWMYPVYYVEYTQFAMLNIHYNYECLLCSLPDLPDGGAAHFAQTVREIKSRWGFGCGQGHRYEIC